MATDFSPRLTPNKSLALTYLPQLDGLRAGAISMVLAAHYLPRFASKLGSPSVRVFFVLSGFLITAILLRCRGESPLHAARQFYARRALRIFPLYYAALALTWAFLPETWADAGWDVPYLSNFKMWWREGWGGVFGHLWSLSVEEQFYLIWPWLILLASSRALVPLVVSAVGCGVCWRVVMVVTGQGPMAAQVPTPACLDTLGAGALLALAWAETPGTARALATLRRFGWIGLGVIPLYVVRSGTPGTLIGADFGMALGGAWLVDLAGRGQGPRILAAAPVRWLGKISYCVYVIHLPILAILNHNIPGLESYRLLNASVAAGFTIAIASLSWRYFEGPVNDLKRHFPYRPRPRVEAVAQPEESVAAPR